MAGFLEFAVHDPLHILPDGVAIGAQDGKALDGGVLHQFGLPAHVRVPLRKIDLHVGDLLHLFLFCHISSSSIPKSRYLIIAPLSRVCIG